MSKILQIAVRDFLATLTTKAFIIGLLVLPTILIVLIAVGPRVFNPRAFQVQAEVAIIDPTGKIAPEVRGLFEPRTLAARAADDLREALASAPETVRQIGENAPVSVPDLKLRERPADADVQQEKKWLSENQEHSSNHRALVVIHPDAIKPGSNEPTHGVYDLYVPPNLDDRTNGEIQSTVHDAIVNVRLREQAIGQEAFEALVRVPRVRSITVLNGNDRGTVAGFNFILPMAFGILLFVGALTGGQALLTSTVEEKSSRVIEVLLSAVSPMQLMAGKLLGQLGVSIVTLSLYMAMGLMALTSFSLLGLLNPWLIVYLVIFFLITYLVYGSLMMAIGSAVNDMREAQSLIMPVMMTLMIPWILWVPISQNPNSTMSTVISFLPAVSGFAMMLRMASVTPPPVWQVWLSIAVGIGSVFGALWFCAKVFRIGLLMYGKAPNLATLIRWARAA
jgi:ABC-2 type transport system permease protein